MTGSNREEEALLRAALPADHPDHPGGDGGADDPLAALAYLDAVPPPTPELLERVRDEVLREPAATPATPDEAPATPDGARAAVAVAVIVVGLGLALAGKSKPQDPVLWLQAGGGLIVAALVGARAAMTEGGRILFAVLAAAGVGLVLAAGEAAGLSVMVGIKCFLFEQATAAAALLAFALTKRGTPRGAASWAGVAGAGALAGLAALHLVCPVRTQTPHLFAFHVGGLGVAIALGGGLGKLRRARAA